MLQINFRKHLILCFLACITCISLFAQTPAERKANKLFENYSYSEAISLYEYVLEKSPNNQQVIRNLATSSVKTGDNQRAEKYLRTLIEAGNAKNEDFLNYALALQTNGKKDEAAKWFVKYDELMAVDKRGKRFSNSLSSYKSFFDESDSYSLELAPFNTSASDFSLTPYNEGFIMVSGGNQRGYSPSKYPWDNNRWLDLFFVSPTGDPKAKKLSRRINTKYHEGPASYSSERKQVAFTRNSFNKGKVKRSGDHINKLSIFFAEPGKRDFKNVVPFKYNSPEFSNGHPAFSADGKKLYFSSDRPGGYGGSDIYVSIYKDSTWSEPRNLGPGINSSGNELFPFVYNDSLLSFASNGWGGMGGLDVFTAEFIGDSLGKPLNQGSPLNSSFDDFSLIILKDARAGYVSSNRPGGKGGDDVYQYTYSPKASKIKVVDSETGKAIPNAEIVFYQASRPMANAVSDQQGISMNMLKPCNTYKAVVKAEHYPEHQLNVEVDCPINSASEIMLKIKRPKLKFHAFDKYKNLDIDKAKVSLKDLSDGKSTPRTAETDAKGNAEFLLEPCHEYEVTLEKEGLPIVSGVFKAACKQGERDSDIRLGTGIPPKRGVLVKVRVTEEQNGDPVNNARIRLFDEVSKEIIDAMTDQSGMYETVMKEGSSWLISTSRIGYFSTSKSKANISINKGSRTIETNLKLLQLREGGIIALEGIFYDLDKADVRPDAAKVLDYVVQVMEENPGLSIELGSHTDSQGKDDYNMKLSDKRAASAAEYIISKGIDKARILGKGYGESRLKNKCSNGEKCTDAEHQENRRTEIRILDVD
ncbi:MAG: OmpA family protein [Bacteroidia bacterium]